MFYAKSQLEGNTPIVFTLTIILTQLVLSLYHPMVAFFLPFIINYSTILLYNLLLLAVKIDKKLHPNQELEENIIEDQFRNHAAEHLVSELTWLNKETIYSYGCNNSHMIIWFLVNLVLIPFMPATLAYLLSMFISGEIAYWLVFHQESWIAKLLYPLIKLSQYFTLLKPKEQHIKTAQLTINKLIELEGEIIEEG